jgi:hypothetical protein
MAATIKQVYMVESKDGKMTVELAPAGGVIVEQQDNKGNKVGPSMEYSQEEIVALLSILPKFLEC